MPDVHELLKSLTIVLAVAAIEAARAAIGD
jgi:hypothetical protein